MCAAMALGAVWLLYAANQYFSSQQQVFSYIAAHADKVKNQKTQIQGRVLSLQSYNEPRVNRVTDDLKAQSEKKLDTNMRFNFEVSKVNSVNLTKPVIVRLAWQAPTFKVLQGQQLSLLVKLKPSHSIANLSGFNYKTWLISKDIVATGYVVNKTKDNSNVSHTLVENTPSIRQLLFNNYQQLLPYQSQFNSILLALGFGDRKQLSQMQWQVLQATGTSHLIAISGLHIGLVASFSYLSCMFFIRLLPLTSDSWSVINTRYLAIFISLCCAVGYGFLAGFSTPTLRALIMLGIFWLSQLLLIRLSYLRWLLFTVFIIILLAPLSLMTASFWLSFTAVALIFFVLWRFQRYFAADNELLRFFKGLMIVQVSLTLLLLPLSALFFSQIPLMALPANLVAVPFMSFIVIPITLVSVACSAMFPSLSVFLIELAGYAIELIWLWLAFLANQPYAVLKLSSLSSQAIMVTIILVLIIITAVASFSGYWRVKYLPNLQPLVKMLVVTLGATLVSGSSLNNHKAFIASSTELAANWQLHLIDVGHGLSVLITQNGLGVLYDTGSSYPSGFNMADAAVLPYLQRLGINQLDLLVLSHGDNDHSGGLAQLAKQLNIKHLLTNVKVPEQTGIKPAACQQGDKFTWQTLTFEVLWPSNNGREESVLRTNDKQKNDDSCVLLITDGHSKVLLTGDISKKVETKLIARYPELEVDVLIVPHHGSKTSSSDLFLASLAPSLAVVSAGYNNRWNMPVPSVVQRYRQHDINLLNTAELGMIVVDFSKQGWVTRNFREDFRPFWISI